LPPPSPPPPPIFPIFSPFNLPFLSLENKEEIVKRYMKIYRKKYERKVG
jgi:hypothetical protein